MSSARRLRSWLAVLLLPLAGLAAAVPAGAGEPRAAAGVLDLRSWDFERDGIAALDGQWHFAWKRFDDPAAPPAPGLQTIAVPGPWNGTPTASGVAGAFGRATYSLTVPCRATAPLALSLPVQHSAAHWYVNGVLVARQGTPGDESAAQATHLQQIANLPAQACPLRIVAHVSNHDIRRGGLVRSVELGDALQLAERRELARMRDLLAIGGLTVLGLLPLLFFLGRRKDFSPLYFGLFCLTFSLGMGLTGTRVLQPLFAPLGWTMFLRLVFFCWYGTSLLYGLFVRAIYPQEVGPRAVRAMVGWAVLSCLTVLFTPASVFTHLLPTLALGAIVLTAYVAWRLAVAWRRGRSTAKWLLGALAVYAAAVTHDALNFTHLMRLALVPYGVLVFVAAPAWLMARRLARALLVEERIAIEQRERADLLVRSTKAGLVDWDAISGRTSYSERFREMLGYPVASDAPPLPPLRTLLHPEDAEKVHGSFLAQLRDRSVRSGVRPGEAMDYRLLRADGESLWVHAEAVSVCGADGRTLRYICSFIDISQAKHDMTRLREQEEALRAQIELTRTEQRRLDLVVRGARVGIVDWDGHTHATYYSPRFREIRGYARDADTSAWPDYFKVMIHPDDRERVTRRWVAFIKGKGPEGPVGEYYAPEEYRLLRSDGSYAWVQVSGIAVRDARGFVTRWIAAIIDIGERRAQEEALRASHDQIAAQAAQLERQNEALKENVRLREEVERIGRHDIKTPLNSIVAVPRLLREERRLGPEADELLGIVERAGYRILSMVNLSLDLYKMEQGSYIFRPDAVDLAELVEKVLADVRVHAGSKGVRFDVELRGVPYAWAEELLCYSLLANLTKNAVEASPEEQAVTIRGEAGAGGTVLLHVHNQGAVPEAIRPHFFQKYATLGKASGTGLGTYSARLMARVQDGDIAMRTSDADGTTVSVTLRAAAEGVVPTSVRHASERGRAGPLQISGLPPTRVLLVDDDEYNLLIVRRFLPSPPFTVETAINGRMALAAAERHWPDVMFMDLDMPVMGGLQAVRELRALEQASGARRCTMIALSSHEDGATQSAALAAGFDRYLTKPVTRGVVQELLLQLARRASGVADDAPVPTRPPAMPTAPADAVLVDADMKPLMGDYLVSRRELIAGMPGRLAAGEREELRRVAHQLAGSFGLYGFRWASAQCRWIEHNFQELDAARLAEVAGRLQTHLDTAQIQFVEMD